MKRGKFEHRMDRPRPEVLFTVYNKKDYGDEYEQQPSILQKALIACLVGITVFAAMALYKIWF